MPYDSAGVKHFNPLEKFHLGLGDGKWGGRDMVNLENGNHIMEFLYFDLPFHDCPLQLRMYYSNRLDETRLF